MDILVDLGWVQVHEFARSRLHRYVSTNLSCLMVLFFLMRQLREKEEISEVLFSLFAIVVDQELSGALLLWWLLKFGFNMSLHLITVSKCSIFATESINRDVIRIVLIVCMLCSKSENKCRCKEYSRI